MREKVGESGRREKVGGGDGKRVSQSHRHLINDNTPPRLVIRHDRLYSRRTHTSSGRHHVNPPLNVRMYSTLQNRWVYRLILRAIIWLIYRSIYLSFNSLTFSEEQYLSIPLLFVKKKKIYISYWIEIFSIHIFGGDKISISAEKIVKLFIQYHGEICYSYKETQCSGFSRNRWENQYHKVKQTVFISLANGQPAQ